MKERPIKGEYQACYGCGQWQLHPTGGTLEVSVDLLPQISPLEGQPSQSLFEGCFWGVLILWHFWLNILQEGVFW